MTSAAALRSGWSRGRPPLDVANHLLKVLVEAVGTKRLHLFTGYCATSSRCTASVSRLTSSRCRCPSCACQLLKAWASSGSASAAAAAGCSWGRSCGTTGVDRYLEVAGDVKLNKVVFPGTHEETKDRVSRKPDQREGTPELAVKEPVRGHLAPHAASVLMTLRGLLALICCGK